jgi:hypothetical protein
MGIVPALAIFVANAGAQWTVALPYDTAQATSALGAERVGPMGTALERVKKKLEAILGGSTGNVVIDIKRESPTNAGAAAESKSYQFYIQTVAVGRDKIKNQAEADSEPASEVLVYESLPATSVPFYWDTGTLRQAGSIILDSALNQHLQFEPHGSGSDAFMRIRPPNATLKWQFWLVKPKQGHELFDVVAIHEALHTLGFSSNGDLASLPTALPTWDLLRVPESAVRVSAADFPTIARELRPTVEASWITMLGTSSGAYKASRGERSGGDGFQASHWRSSTRLSPPNPIGVMDPTMASAQLYEANGNVLLSRADVEALDLIGWNVNPGAHVYANGNPVNLLSPTPGQKIPANSQITFQWQSSPNPVNGWLLFIDEAEAPYDDMPVRAFDGLTSPSYTLPAAQSLAPGKYKWEVTAQHELGNQHSADGTFTVLCPADFNGDGFVNGNDYDLFVDAFDVGDPSADFDHDGFVNGNDYDLFVEHFDVGC